MKYKYLSHSFKGKMPVYGGETKVKVDPVKSILKGDSANVFEFTLQNHWGTHIDAPRHFFHKGKTINDYSADQWVFRKPQVIAVSLEPGQSLELSGWEKNIAEDTDILILKSGWSDFREEEKYYKENPGIDPAVALFLRENFINIKAIGIDWISISSILNRPKYKMEIVLICNTDIPFIYLNLILLTVNFYFFPTEFFLVWRSCNKIISIFMKLFYAE